MEGKQSTKKICHGDNKPGIFLSDLHAPKTLIVYWHQFAMFNLWLKFNNSILNVCTANFEFPELISNYLKPRLRSPWALLLSSIPLLHLRLCIFIQLVSFFIINCKNVLSRLTPSRGTSYQGKIIFKFVTVWIAVPCSCSCEGRSRWCIEFL